MKDIKARFTSRKFLMSLLGLALVLLVPEQAEEIVVLVGIFVGAEGSRDLAEAVKRNK